jgi:hypothetical protein
MLCLGTGLACRDGMRGRVVMAAFGRGLWGAARERGLVGFPEEL